MKTNFTLKQQLIGVSTIIILLIFADYVEAQYGGRRRRTRRRTAVVVSSATHEKDQEDAAAAQESEQAAPKDTTAPKDNTTQQTSTQGDHLPYGKVVNNLPEGCNSEAVNDVEYYHCGNDYYRAAYQENNLVYVTTEPPQ